MIYNLNSMEYEYICSIIPLQHAIWFFTKNSKTFNKVYPGHRAKSLDEHGKERALLQGVRSNNSAVLGFIFKHIEDWLDEISEYYEKKKEELGDSEAIIDTLASSVFSKNIALYFKLADNGEEWGDIGNIQSKVQLVVKYKEKMLEFERRALDSEERLQRVEKSLSEINALKESMSTLCSKSIKEREEERKKNTELSDEIIRLLSPSTGVRGVYKRERFVRLHGDRLWKNGMLPMANHI